MAIILGSGYAKWLWAEKWKNTNAANVLIAFLPGLDRGRETSWKTSAREREVRRKFPLLVLSPKGTNRQELLGFIPRA